MAPPVQLLEQRWLEYGDNSSDVCDPLLRAWQCRILSKTFHALVEGRHRSSSKSGQQGSLARRDSRQSSRWRAARWRRRRSSSSRQWSPPRHHREKKAAAVVDVMLMWSAFMSGSLRKTAAKKRKTALTAHEDPAAQIFGFPEKITIKAYCTPL